MARYHCARIGPDWPGIERRKAKMLEEMKMQGLILDYAGVLDGDDEDVRRWQELLAAVRAAVSYTHLTLPTNREV